MEPEKLKTLGSDASSTESLGLPGIASQIGKFSISSLKPTTTRVRTRDGKLYEENIKEQTVVLKGHEVIPFLSEDSEENKTLPSWQYDRNKKRWERSKASDTPSDCAIDDSLLSFVTYNVWFHTFFQEERARALFEIIRTIRPHFICFQEVTEPFLKMLLQEDWICNEYVLSDANGYSVYPYGVLILTRLKPAIFTIRWMPSNMGRRFLCCECRLGGKKLLVSTIHLESLQNTDVRTQQLKMIFPLLKDCDFGFLMGDFNFGDEKPECEHLDADFADLWQQTNSSMPVADSFTIDGARYDRILYRRKSCKGRSCRLLGTTALSVNSNEQVFPSDHKGLHGVVELCDL
eukprot:TRINITY_DN5699_c0_g1_i1.p1 TRINITY_DN5699_c0_g1~~TRINITY_DN5699_c0_g1_i1.p1  ORF type:complete len:347 (+),score=56.79 TRINITY_DN5699_c0_g1_i1:94-1134(+)